MDWDWRRTLAYIYAGICVFDFVVVPMWIGIVRTDTETYLHDFGAYSEAVQLAIIEGLTFQHEPFTLKGAGLFHLAFGALLTGSVLSDKPN